MTENDLLATHTPTRSASEGVIVPRLRFGLVSFLLLVGCRSGASDLVEDQLRQRENEARELRDELCRTQAYNDALQRELRAVRGVTPTVITPEFAGQTFTIKSLTLGRQTGGYQADDCPGDQALQVVLEPRDPDGHTLKAPGAVQVEALEVNQEGLKRLLSTWQVPPDDLRRSWKSGLLTTGYFLVLPWKVPPTTEKLRVVVNFTLADGRVFEADKDVTVHPPQPGKHAPLPLAPPPGAEPLPPPKQMHGPALQGARAAPTATWQTSAYCPAQLLPPVPKR